MAMAMVGSYTLDGTDDEDDDDNDDVEHDVKDDPIVDWRPAQHHERCHRCRIRREPPQAPQDTIGWYPPGGGGGVWRQPCIIHTRICMYVCLYVCMSVCMYVCMYV